MLRLPMSDTPVLIAPRLRFRTPLYNTIHDDTVPVWPADGPAPTMTPVQVAIKMHDGEQAKEDKYFVLSMGYRSYSVK